MPPDDKIPPPEDTGDEVATDATGAAQEGDATPEGAPVDDAEVATQWPALDVEHGEANAPISAGEEPVAIDPDAAMPDAADVPTAEVEDTAAAWPVAPAGSVWGSLQPADPLNAGPVVADEPGDAKPSEQSEPAAAVSPAADLAEKPAVEAGADDPPGTDHLVTDDNEVAEDGGDDDADDATVVGAETSTDDDQPALSDDQPADADESPSPGGRTVFMPPSDNAAPAAEEARTVFQPPSPPAGDAAGPAAGESRTVFVPPTPATIPPAPAAAAPPVGDQPVDGFIAGNQTFFPRRDGGGIQVGDVLNHMFEVTRYITRGGMGEVFEGLNISSGERVAIKVMLPSLAADESVQAMFRREARTLTRLAHPALVQYRVMAQEPQLGVLYIVTEYIDGANLDTVMGDLKPSAAEIAALGRRLADGLRVAHSLDAIHRDISPDNVMLEGGRLDKAKIIDFGIAKDLDASTKTIVGDGFAGKLNYVAPEQLGDFGRDVGPWSDVYSLGLVLLALARGRDVDMGATMVDAVDRRRAGPDLSDAPDALRAVLAQMLVANPAHRLRSMDAVIAAFDGAPPPGEAQKDAKPAKPVKTPGATGDANGAGRFRTLAIIGGAALVAIVAAIFLLLPGSKPPAATGGGTTTATQTTRASGGAATTAAGARSAIAAALPGIGCSWLVPTVGDAPGGGVAVSATGVARDSGEAQGAIARAVTQAGGQATSLNFDDVAAIEPALCPMVDALRPVQSDGGRLSVSQREFELSGANGDVSTKALITLDPGPEGSNLALYGIEENNMQAISGSRADIMAKARDPRYAEVITANADGSLRLSITTKLQGLKGIVLLTGPRPFAPGDLTLLDKPASGYDAAWGRRVAQAARDKGWKAEIVWYRVVDNKPG